jgi:hypothetical protein
MVAMGRVSPWVRVTLFGDTYAAELHHICTMVQDRSHKALTTQELSENVLVKQYYQGV